MLIGPRQTGKSTLLKSLKPNLIIDLALESTYRDHLKDPSLIESLVHALPSGPQIILIDEVQRLPSILNTVQSMIDSSRDRIFLLTGSSAHKLKGGRTNLLPGRLFRLDLAPLSFWELSHMWDGI